MRIPPKPPTLHDLMRDMSAEKLSRVGGVVSSTHHDRYLHWDELRRLDPPGELSSEEWWLAIKLARLYGARRLPLTDAEGRPFTFSMPHRAACIRSIRCWLGIS